MMFAVADLSTTTCGYVTNNGHKVTKVRYGNYFSGVTADKWGENDEIKVLKRMKKAEERLKRRNTEESEGEQRGRAKRLVEKLAKLLTAGDLPFLTASRKTWPSRDKAMKSIKGTKLLQLQQQQQHRSHNSSQSSLFEPMPTIVEETDTELMEQLQQTGEWEDGQRAEAAPEGARNNGTMWKEWGARRDDPTQRHSAQLGLLTQQFASPQPMLQAAA